MKYPNRDVWLPFAFCVALSAIAMVTWSATEGSNAWVPAVLCFLPMTFFFSAMGDTNTRRKVLALEERLRRVEGAPPA